MKYLVVFLISFLAVDVVLAQSNSVQHISRLEIKKKKTVNISKGDSSVTVIIDTLIMNDRSRLEFYGKKDVTLKVKHAIIPQRAYISGTDGKNNASNLDITIRFDELGSLFVLAGGRDANNGSKTFPNGNGGKVTFNYLSDGIIPQQTDKSKGHYVVVDTKAGGYSVNARSDLYNIYSRIGSGSRPLAQLPQGQVFSGSPGIDGKSEIKEVSEF